MITIQPLPLTQQGISSASREAATTTPGNTHQGTTTQRSPHEANEDIKDACSNTQNASHQNHSSSASNCTTGGSSAGFGKDTCFKKSENYPLTNSTFLRICPKPTTPLATCCILPKAGPNSSELEIVGIHRWQLPWKT
eukprot:scaffold100637_cov14-Tisochrysis_lutea.AAC.1